MWRKWRRHRIHYFYDNRIDKISPEGRKLLCNCNGEGKLTFLSFNIICTAFLTCGASGGVTCPLFFTLIRRSWYLQTGRESNIKYYANCFA